MLNADELPLTAKCIPRFPPNSSFYLSAEPWIPDKSFEVAKAVRIKMTQKDFYFVNDLTSANVLFVYMDFMDFSKAQFDRYR